MNRVIGDVMTGLPLCVEPETSLRELVELFSEQHLSGAPVILPGGALVGLVSASDLIDFLANHPGSPAGHPDVPEWGEIEAAAGAGDEPRDDPEVSGWFVDMWENAGAEVVTRLAEVSGPEWDILDEHAVSEVMTQRLVSVTPETRLEDAARLLLDNSLHRLLVVDQGRLVGIVTSNDLLGSMTPPNQAV